MSVHIDCPNMRPVGFVYLRARSYASRVHEPTLIQREVPLVALWQLSPLRSYPESIEKAVLSSIDDLRADSRSRSRQQSRRTLSSPALSSALPPPLTPPSRALARSPDANVPRVLGVTVFAFYFCNFLPLKLQHFTYVYVGLIRIEAYFPAFARGKSLVLNVERLDYSKGLPWHGFLWMANSPPVSKCQHNEDSVSV